MLKSHRSEARQHRNRDQEFTLKDIRREDLVSQLESLIPMITGAVSGLTPEQLMFDDAIRSNSYVLTQLCLHLNYHLGQVNYLRRMLEA